MSLPPSFHQLKNTRNKLSKASPAQVTPMVESRDGTASLTLLLALKTYQPRPNTQDGKAQPEVLLPVVPIVGNEGRLLSTMCDSNPAPISSTPASSWPIIWDSSHAETSTALPTNRNQARPPNSDTLLLNNEDTAPSVHNIPATPPPTPPHNLHQHSASLHPRPPTPFHHATMCLTITSLLSTQKLWQSTIIRISNERVN